MQEIPFCCRINVIDLNTEFRYCDVPLIQEIRLCLSPLGAVGGLQSVLRGTSLCPGGGTGRWERGAFCHSVPDMSY